MFRDVNTDRIRILILGLNYSPEPTGNAPYTTSLAEGLSSLGHRVRVVTAHPHYPEWRIRDGYGGWSKREKIGQVPVLRLRHWVPKKPAGMQRLASEISFGLRLLFTRIGRPDVVLLVSPALFSTALVLARLRVFRRSLPIGIWVQDLYSLGIAETGQGGRALVTAMKAVESKTLRGADGVAVIHERFARYVEGALGAQSVSVIRNWSHVSTPASTNAAGVRSSYGYSEDETLVLHAGNQGAKQGLENIVEAARRADADCLPIRFLLLGDGNQRRRLEELAKGVQRIEFIDPLPDAQFNQLLNSADVLIVNERPGLAEMAVPSKLTTYFSTGLPVVAVTDADSITAQEISLSGGGVRVNTADPAALCTAILALRNDAGMAKTLGENGLAFRREILGSEAAIDRYAKWLVSLATTRGRLCRAERPQQTGTND